MVDQEADSGQIVVPEIKPPERAVFFIDGANFYKRLTEIGVPDPNDLDLREVAKKLAGTRVVSEIRYYTGKVTRDGDRRILASQQRLFERLKTQQVKIVLGRVEQRSEPNDLAQRLLELLASPSPDFGRLTPPQYKQLFALANTHRTVDYHVQKAVDTLLAVDIAGMALSNAYDTAYVLSQDGDMVPGITLARTTGGKKVFGVGTRDRNYHVAQACNSYIPVDVAWFVRCYLPRPATPVKRFTPAGR